MINLNCYISKLGRETSKHHSNDKGSLWQYQDNLTSNQCITQIAQEVRINKSNNNDEDNEEKEKKHCNDNNGINDLSQIQDINEES